jgi:uncharacterized damage-inducible protein DinB
MIDTLLHLYARNLDYAQALVGDLSETQVCAQPAEAVNHPAWVIGHLAMTSDRVVNKGVLQGQAQLPDAWSQPFGPNSTPVSDREQYPAMDELCQALSSIHQHVDAAVRALDDQALNEANPMQRLADRLPTKGHALTHVLIAHENLHLGQLSAWRRVQGYPAVSLG